jgi:RNA polymerase sigma factor (TIGR02999 family)
MSPEAPPPTTAGTGPDEADAPDTMSTGPRDEVLNTAFAAAYDDLYRLASGHRRRWRGNETLNTTALVHEVYLKLAQRTGALRNPACLLAVAARAMRHVLVNYAEAQRSAKRGGALERVPLATLGATTDEPAGSPATADEVLALNDALEGLAVLSARQRDVVECRFFGGLSVEETAEALEISTATVKRDWRLARAWLYQQLRSSSSD